ncbi:MAG: hypothetical protein RL343_907 [Actinomycetota bacterium]
MKTSSKTQAAKPANTPWLRIGVIWAATLIASVVIALTQDRAHAFAWYGAILAGSMALVSVAHLIKSSIDGFVRELIYVAGGSYLILALTSVYLFIAS